MVRHKLVLTYQDYLQMPDDRNRREILDGDLYVTPAPSPGHQRAVVNLVRLLENHLAGRGLGKLYVAPVDVILSQIDVVQPDLAFVRADRLGIVTRSGIQGAPDLVIEVLSPSTGPVDRGPKKETYARFGVQEYWIADPDARTLEIYCLEGATYSPVQAAGTPPGPRSLLFPDLTFDLQSLWD